jgi:hypothetical protein
LQMQSLAQFVIARGGSPEAISKSPVSVILHSAFCLFCFYLVLLSGDMVSGPSLWIIFLALKRDLKLAEKEVPHSKN